MKRKIVTIMLCFALSASFTVPVIATETSETTTVEEAKPKKTSKKKKLKKKLKKNYGLKFQGEVKDDSTGNWRWAEYDSDTGFETFAADYYKAFVKDDKEVHIIINRKTNITYRLNIYGTLYIMAMEYVQGEENNAVAMCTGYPLAQFEVDPKTGAIESVDVSELQADYVAPPTSSTAASESILQTFVSVGTPYLQESYGDNCEMYADESTNTVYCKAWAPGVGAAAIYAKLGDADCVASYQLMKAGTRSAAEAYYNILSEYDPTAHLVYAIMDDTNLDNTILTYYDGICAYDYLSE